MMLHPGESKDECELHLKEVRKRDLEEIAASTTSNGNVNNGNGDGDGDICMDGSGIQESLQGAHCSKSTLNDKGHCCQSSVIPLLRLIAISPCTTSTTTVKVAPMNFKWLVRLSTCKFAMKSY